MAWVHETATLQKRMCVCICIYIKGKINFTTVQYYRPHSTALCTPSFPCGQGFRSLWVTESCTLGGIVEHHLDHFLHSKQVQLQQVVWGLIWSSYGYLQGRRFHRLSGQPMALSDHPIGGGKISFFTIRILCRNLSVLPLVLALWSFEESHRIIDTGKDLQGRQIQPSTWPIESHH